MRNRLALLCLLTSSIAAHAQLSPEPDSSLNDGIPLQPFANSLNALYWPSSGLANYRQDGSSLFVRPSEGGTDAYGQTWTRTAPSRDNMRANGGTFRAIFLGSGDSGFYSAGYSYEGSPLSPDAYTLCRTDHDDAFGFGNVADLALLMSEVDAFDFWFCAGDRAYTIFDPSRSVVGASGVPDVLWTAAPILVPSYLSVSEDPVLVQTWIVSVVDRATGADAEGREFRFALQQFVPSGSTLPNVPVPEPSTYAFAGALGCIALALRRTRLRRKQN